MARAVGQGIADVPEMAGDGFELVARFDDWNDDGERFCMVFLRQLAAAEPAP